MVEHRHGEGEAEVRVLRGFALAAELSVGILALEAVGAVLSRSLAVTVDAVHNLPDIVAFVVSWAALHATESGASEHRTFGAHRLEVFASLVNATLVLVTGVVFAFEALVAVTSHSSFAGPVDAVWVVAVALPTLALRTANLRVLQSLPGRIRDLNLRSVVVHLFSDLVITGGLLAAGTVLWLVPSATQADPVAALAIAGVLVYESVPLFRDGWEVLTERIPRNLSIDEISAAAQAVAGVDEIHDIHVWAVCPSLVCMTAHVRVRDMPVSRSMDLSARLRRTMEREFGILHAVFEMETVSGPGEPRDHP